MGGLTKGGLVPILFEPEANQHAPGSLNKSLRPQPIEHELLLHAKLLR